MKIRLFLFILFISVLIVYSSSIEFMPNYYQRGDRWHLVIPMLTIYLLEIGAFLFLVVDMIKRKKMKWFEFMIFILFNLCFPVINADSGFFSNFAYVVIGILSLTLLISMFEKKIWRQFLNH